MLFTVLLPRKHYQNHQDFSAFVNKQSSSSCRFQPSFNENLRSTFLSPRKFEKQACLQPSPTKIAWGTSFTCYAVRLLHAVNPTERKTKPKRRRSSRRPLETTDIQQKKPRKTVAPAKGQVREKLRGARSPTDVDSDTEEETQDVQDDDELEEYLDKEDDNMMAPRNLPKRRYEGESMTAYLHEIGTVSLLDSDKEIELSTAIVELTTLEKLRRSLAEQLGRLPSEEEWATAAGLVPGDSFRRKIYLGRRAKHRLVQANLRWVVAIAKTYTHSGNMSLQDLIQEGTLGLIKAAEKYDPTRGYRFLTYATWWIRQSIHRSLHDNGRTIRLPVQVHSRISQIKKARIHLYQKLERIPRDEEVAAYLGMSTERLRFIVQSAALPVSLDAPVSSALDAGESVLGDYVQSDMEHPAEAVDRRLMEEDVDTVLGTLTARERDIIRMRYGLDDGNIKSLEVVGEAVGLTRERIRQIEISAMRKLRHPMRNFILHDYIM